MQAQLSILKSSYIQLFLIISGILLTYGFTLDVPFYLDDFSSIQENPIIYEWDGSLAQLWYYAPLRIVGYLSFALNYHFHHFEVSSYHIVNIIIHILAGFAVFGLIRGLIHTPVLKKKLTPEAKAWLPIVVALIFVLHPLQIQAVTYIVQRLASLAALFYLASLACYLQARLAKSWQTISLWATASFLLALLAFFTKQNTATLPIAILLIEFIFFPGRALRLVLSASITLIALGGAWVIAAYMFNYDPFSLQAMLNLTQETKSISRESYLATQFSVIWHYIRLFFVPTSLHIDYAYPITNNLLIAPALIGLWGHILLLGIAIYVRRLFPLVAFGILFYYLAHAVESSVIPIRDVIFEHRTYLPNLGLITLCAWLLITYIPRWLDQTTMRVVVIILLVGMSVATWQRNEIWRDPIALWSDNVEKSPEKKRGWVILGKHLIQFGKTQAGLKALERSAEITRNLDGSELKTYTVETILNMVVAYKKLQQYDLALHWIERSLKNPELRPFDRAKFYVNQGNVFFELHRYADAETSYRQAIQFYPQSLSARANLASILAATGRENEAEQMYLEILAINPNHAIVKQNLEKLRARTHIN